MANKYPILSDAQDASGKVSIQDEGTPVTGTPHTTLNFVGTGVAVTDGGSGVATVTVTGGGSGEFVAVTGFDTTTNTMLTGQAGYIETAGTARVKQARADALSSSRVVGFYNGTAGAMLVSGKITAIFEGSLTLNNGDPVFLSKITAGRLTNDTTTHVSPDVEAEVGIVFNASTYTGSAGDFATIMVQVKAPIAL